jgi:type II secretory pathway pseudopilin PulG
MIVVIAIIAIMSAVALPNIAGYLRNYTIRGAAQQVAGEMQQARSKAIMGNVNNGITFAIVDVDSYRWVSDDAQAQGQNPYLGPLQELPQGVRFVAAGGGTASLRFSRLGTVCIPGTANCGAAFPVGFCSGPEAGRCANGPSPATTYIATAALPWRVTVRETLTGAQRTITIGNGGRIVAQQ